MPAFPAFFCLQISAAVLALALTHVLQLTGMLQWWTRQTVEVENNMTSVERMVEYINLPQEPPRCVESDDTEVEPTQENQAVAQGAEDMQAEVGRVQHVMEVLVVWGLRSRSCSLNRQQIDSTIQLLCRFGVPISASMD
jgi:hypothetical protein